MKNQSRPQEGRRAQKMTSLGKRRQQHGAPRSPGVERQGKSGKMAEFTKNQIFLYPFLTSLYWREGAGGRRSWGLNAKSEAWWRARPTHAAGLGLTQYLQKNHPTESRAGEQHSQCGRRAWRTSPWHPNAPETRDRGPPTRPPPSPACPPSPTRSPKPSAPSRPSPRPAPSRTTLVFTRRVLGLCGGAGARWFPALRTASRARVRGCWAGDAFSGLMFSWSSWGAVCCKVSGAEPASRAAEEPNIPAPRPRRVRRRRQAACTRSRRPAAPRTLPPWAPAAARPARPPPAGIAESREPRAESCESAGTAGVQGQRPPETKRAARGAAAVRAVQVARDY